MHKDNSPLQVDIAIIGGNLVGSATALAMEKLGLSIAIIEKEPPNPEPFNTQQPYGLRVSAIIPIIKNFLYQLGVWEELLPARIQAVKKMQVWEGQLTQSLIFEQPQAHHNAVAWIVENNHIQHTCWQLLKNTKCQQIIGEWQHIEKRDNHEGYTLKVRPHGASPHQDRTLHAKLIIAADGANSSIRQWCGIASMTKPYHQHCIVGNVQTSNPHQAIAWQRYHQGRAFAFLPLADGSCSIAWYVDEKNNADILAKNTAQQKQLMYDASGGMLGHIESIQQLASFPIVRSDSQKLYAKDLVLIGDAIRTIHPMAGQGVNLGLADVAVLQDILLNALQHNIPITTPLLLRKYARQRSEYKLIQTAMDGIHSFFNNSIIEKTRPTLIQKINSFSIGKQWLNEIAMGYHSDVPKSLKKH